MLNVHGDSLRATTGAHGSDIASQRIDDLDRRALRHLLRMIGRDGAAPVCIDLGCGLGWQGVRFALLGARAHLFDQLPQSALVGAVRASGAALSYTRCDLNALQGGDLPPRVCIAFSQRSVHYLHPRAARGLIRVIAARMARGGLFFLSASGMSSELGMGYPGAAVPWEARFAQLDPLMQVKHGITAPVCLYSEGDLAQLMACSGFEIIATWSSAFGNIKGVFRRRA